jgi:sporulation protein YlmC with PRC-barrel domain
MKDRNIEIPVEAQVICTDGNCGRSIGLLINPVFELVTHVVVKEEIPPEREYIVPVDLIFQTTSEMIQLTCSKAEFERLESFTKTEYIEEKMPIYYSGYSETYGLGTHFLWPYVSPERNVSVPVEHPQIPPGELIIRRGAKVEANDGPIGQIDEFMINPDNGHITHLVMREGHHWGKKDVIIPLSAIKEAHKDKVILKIDKHAVGSLPAYKIHRGWLVAKGW